MTEQYVHVDISQNLRMSELEAAWLRLQLPDLAADNAPAGRRSPGATARPRRDCAGRPTTPTTSSTSASLRVADRDARPRRSSRERGVATGVHYPLALTQQPAYRAPRRRRLPGGRGVGGRVRLAALLPRAHRRRGRAPSPTALEDLGQ